MICPLKITCYVQSTTFCQHHSFACTRLHTAYMFINTLWKNLQHPELSVTTLEHIFPTQTHKIQGSFQFRLCLDQVSHILLSLPITTNIRLNSKPLVSGTQMKIGCWFPPISYILYLPPSKLEDTELRI